MEFGLICLALGIAAAGYFIGSGLKNFQNPDVELGHGLFQDDDDEYELLTETDIHHFIGITKEDAKSLLLEYPEIPHITINQKVYYPKAGLRQWLKKAGE